MKAHIGADSDSGLVHTVTATAANVADITETHALLHGEEKAAHADAAYLGVEKREEIAARHPAVEFHVAAKRGKIKAMKEGPLKEAITAAGEVQSSDSGAGGAFLPCREEPFSAPESAIPRHGEEPGSTPHTLCLVQSLLSPTGAAGRSYGLIARVSSPMAEKTQTMPLFPASRTRRSALRRICCLEDTHFGSPKAHKIPQRF